MENPERDALPRPPRPPPTVAVHMDYVTATFGSYYFNQVTCA